MWDLPGPGLEPVSPALAGGFLTTAPPGKSLSNSLEWSLPCLFNPINAVFLWHCPSFLTLTIPFFFAISISIHTPLKACTIFHAPNMKCLWAVKFFDHLLDSLAYFVSMIKKKDRLSDIYRESQVNFIGIIWKVLSGFFFKYKNYFQRPDWKIESCSLLVPQTSIWFCRVFHTAVLYERQWIVFIQQLLWGSELWALAHN